MGIPSVVTICFIFDLLACLSESRASVIQKERNAENAKLEEFTLKITEGGTTFAEKFKIDEEKDLEYLYVPAHNQVTEAADYLYDFKSGVAIRRVKSEASCYVGPLPDDLPKPADLKAELQGQSQVPRPQNKTTVQKYWFVSEQVDKNLLSKSGQEFCGQFLIYRLREMSLNFTNERLGDGAQTRLARDLDPAAFLNGLGFCNKEELHGVRTTTECSPIDYVYSVKIRQVYCTWWLDCRFTEGAKRLDPCFNYKHLFNSMVCYTIRCP